MKVITVNAVTKNEEGADVSRRLLNFTRSSENPLQYMGKRMVAALKYCEAINEYAPTTLIKLSNMWG